jgi:hypothetical protein
MKRIAQFVLLAILLGIAGAITFPAVIFTSRLVETWTSAYTAQLLGGFLGICGGTLAIVGVLVGAGLFARLAGWRSPRQTPELPAWGSHDMPPVDGQWRQLPPAPTEPTRGALGTPPWGATGGGHFDLLPPPPQDRRFDMDTPEDGS